MLGEIDVFLSQKKTQLIWSFIYLSCNPPPVFIPKGAEVNETLLFNFTGETTAPWRWKLLRGAIQLRSRNTTVLENRWFLHNLCLFWSAWLWLWTVTSLRELSLISAALTQSLNLCYTVDTSQSVMRVVITWNRRGWLGHPPHENNQEAVCQQNTTSKVGNADFWA